MSQLLLAVDTSGKNGSLALAEITPDASEPRALEVAPLAGGAFSAQLVPQIASVLERHGYSKSDLRVLVVASGPGSFTGLRVGLAAVKGLAEALGAPIVPVSLLEAVACAGSIRGLILAGLDAGRGDIYAGVYECEHPRQSRMLSERLLSREEFLAEAEGKAVVVPDGPLVEDLSATGIAVRRIAYPDSSVLAGLGWTHYQRGRMASSEELEANYLRRSDAELYSKPLS